jgi:putative peptidoglycan lipid II flippase
MAGFVLSNLTGLFRQVLVSNAFGTTAEIDAFNAAAQLPDTLFMLVAGGALASAFIPTYTELLEKGRKEDAWVLASALMNLVSLVLAGVSLLALLFAPTVVRTLLAPQFSPAQQALTASILRVLLISPTVFGISGLLMGILNTHQHFILPAIAPTLHWVGWIIGVFFFVPSQGIHGLAWGAVLGAGLHLLVQLPGLRGLGGRYTFTLGLHLPAIREVARLMGPRVIGVAVVQLNFWINVILASGMPEGSLTAIKVAFAVMTMPQVVIAQAIAIAALPTFAAQIARGERSQMRASLAATLRGVILLSLPAAVGLILLRQPIVSMLFERGEFDARSTELVAWALLWYTAGLVSHSIVEIVSRAFYAMHDTRTPVVVGAGAMGLNVALSLALAAGFTRIGWLPHGGLALANTLATSLELLVLLFLMRRQLNGLNSRSILRGTGQAAAGSLAMGLVLAAWISASAPMNPWVIGLGGVALGGALYALTLLLLRVQEARLLLASLTRRLGRFRSTP